MKITTRQCLYFALTMLLLMLSPMGFAKTDTTESNALKLSYEEAFDLRYAYPDSSIKLLEIYHDKYASEKDTLMTISCLIRLANLYGHRAKYKESYDRLWMALLLADAANMDLSKASIYRAIGRHYSFYNREENALKFLNLSLDIKKNLVAEGELDKANLTNNYHAICATYRELGNTLMGRKYLDSSYMFYDSTISIVNISFLEFEKAVLHNHEQKYEEALQIFQKILPWFEKYIPSYQVLVYNYLGDTYKELKQFSESETCYQKALRASAIHNSHIDFTPLIHERLANLYHENGFPAKAYESMKRAKELDGLFFDSRSSYNSSLLEIQDAFRQEKEEQTILMKEQRLAQLEQEEKVLFLEKVILAGLLVFLLLFGGLYLNHVKSRHRIEKQLMREKREMEMKKAHEIVELKNKELAASTLKLIEKETFINSIKEKLNEKKGDLAWPEISGIIRTISNRNTANWEEFEARFVSVNTNFYKKLNTQFPKLTQGDLKVCALVKLNFSSKEIAKLLGISVESVHTTRYRLRKKMKLPRETNLTEFIASV